MSETETIKEEQLSIAEVIVGKFARKCQHCDFDKKPMFFTTYRHRIQLLPYSC